MKTKVTPGIILTMLLIGMLTLAFSVQPATAIVVSPLEATVDIYPDTLNLQSRGKLITGYIELPEGYDVNDINVSSILLNTTIPVDTTVPPSIGDYDNDTIPDLMVKFNRTIVVEYIISQTITYGNVTLTLEGSLYADTPFEGSDIVKVSALFGDVNCDGEVTIYDVSEACGSYTCTEEEPDWNSNANFAPPWNVIDIYDIVTVACYYGQTHP